MEYTNIISLVPQGEHFDPTAMNEGVWLTESHINAIESSLGTYTSAGTVAQETINDRDQQIQSLTDQLNASKQVVTERDATIATQAAEIERLKAGPAGEQQQTKKEGTDNLNHGAAVEEDEITKENKRIRAARGLDINF